MFSLFNFFALVNKVVVFMLSKFHPPQDNYFLVMLSGSLKEQAGQITYLLSQALNLIKTSSDQELLQLDIKPRPQHQKGKNEYCM